MERPQSGGAGCGYTSLFEAIVSSPSVQWSMLRNVDNRAGRAHPSRTDKCQSGSDQGTSHKLIDHRNYFT